MFNFGLIGQGTGGDMFPKCIVGFSNTPDHGYFNSPMSFAGDFDITIRFASINKGNQILFGSDHLTSLYFNISETSGASVWSAGASHNFSTAGLQLWDGKQHTITYKRRGNTFQLIIDGVASELAEVGDEPYTGENLFRIADSNNRHDYFQGSILGLSFNDLATPENNLNYQFDSGSFSHEMPNGHEGTATDPLAMQYYGVTAINWVCGDQWVEVGTDGVDDFGFLLGSYGDIYPTDFLGDDIFRFTVNITDNIVLGQLGSDGTLFPPGVLGWNVKVQGMVRELYMEHDPDAGYYGVADADGAAYIAANVGSKIKFSVEPVYA